MVNFHEHKLWQDAYVALLDIHEALDDVEKEDRVVSGLLDAAQKVAATIADALTRSDRRVSQSLVFDAVGIVAVTRTELAIAWGRGFMNDETFRGLDERYAKISESLQNSKLL